MKASDLEWRDVLRFKVAYSRTSCPNCTYNVIDRFVEKRVVRYGCNDCGFPLDLPTDPCNLFFEPIHSPKELDTWLERNKIVMTMGERREIKNSFGWWEKLRLCINSRGNASYEIFFVNDEGVLSGSKLRLCCTKRSQPADFAVSRVHICKMLNVDYHQSSEFVDGLELRRIA